jgi:glutaredoxin
MSEFVVLRGEFPCKWCDAAANLLVERGLPHTIMKLPMGELILKQASVGHQTVPMIYVDNTFLGGFTELEAYLGD